MSEAGCVPLGLGGDSTVGPECRLHLISAREGSNEQFNLARSSRHWFGGLSGSGAGFALCLPTVSSQILPRRESRSADSLVWKGTHWGVEKGTGRASANSQLGGRAHSLGSSEQKKLGVPKQPVSPLSPPSNQSTHQQSH